MIPLPFREAFVLPEGHTQCLSDDVIAVAFEVLAVPFEFYDQFPVEFGLDVLANRFNLLRNVCRHGLTLSPGIYPAKNENAWAGATPEWRRPASGSGRARGAQTGVAPAHAPTLRVRSFGP